MQLTHITSIEKAIEVTTTKKFSPTISIVSDRGMNFVHPKEGQGGNQPSKEGAKLICDWSGPVIPANVSCLPLGTHRDRTSQGNPGTMYDDTGHVRYFLPVGTFQDLTVIQIDFYDEQKLRAYLEHVIETETKFPLSIGFRVLRWLETNDSMSRITESIQRPLRHQMDGLVSKYSSELKKKYASIHVPISVDD